MKPTSAFEKLFFSSVRIATKNQDGKESVGTGFFINQRINKEESLFFLCTAKHVVSDMKECVIFMHTVRNDEVQLGNPIRVELDKFENEWIKHDRFDVAILSIGKILNELQANNNSPYLSSIDIDFIPTANEISDYIDAVEDVFFVGYPDDKYDRVNMIPIMRKGISATPFSINYSGEPKFLIDASIYEGSSGSPILICNPDSFSIKGRGLHSGHRIFFLGLISATYQRIEDAQYIDLGICCKSTLVKELILKFANENHFEIPERIPISITI